MLPLLLIWYLRGVPSGHGKMLLSHTIPELILIQAIMIDHKDGKTHSHNTIAFLRFEFEIIS